MTQYFLLTFLTIIWLLPPVSLGQCPISPSRAVMASEWDAIFTQDGPGKGLESEGTPGWTGGDSTYSLLLPNGDTAFFFSDSYIGESPRLKGDGTVTRSAAGLRTTELNCPAPMCEPAASVFQARNSIVILNRDRKQMKTLVGPKNEYGVSGSYFKEPIAGLNYWMGDAILLPATRDQKERIFVFLHKFDSKLAFHGAAVAQLNTNTLAIEKLLEIKNLPGRDIHWGTAMLEDKGQLYIYGKGARDRKKQMFVARTRADSKIEYLSDAAVWAGWDGKAWTRNLASVTSISPTSDSVSDEFNVVRVKVNGRTTYTFAGIDTSVPWGKWRDITLYSACEPNGPFTGKHVVLYLDNERFCN